MVDTQVLKCKQVLLKRLLVAVLVLDQCVEMLDPPENLCVHKILYVLPFLLFSTGPLNPLVPFFLSEMDS